MLTESVRDFALRRLRPAAEDADAACAAPAELLAQANELGLTMVGVPEELGGAVEERSAVTSVLMSEALAQGDMGIAVACLAPAGVSTALSLWGDADQQATYLPEFVGENVPAAALAVLEPRAAVRPVRAARRRRAAPAAATCSTASSRSSRAPATASCSSSPPSSRARGPALFIVESGTAGISVEPEPAMGIRAAATGRLIFEDVTLPAGALLGEASPTSTASASSSAGSAGARSPSAPARPCSTT